MPDSAFTTELSSFAKKIAALLLAAAAILIFSVYREPLWGTWLPRFLYWIPRHISGEKTVVHQAGILGAIMAIVLVVLLSLRGFLPTHKSVCGLLMLGIDIYLLALLFDVVFGDTGKFLQGGTTSMLAVAAFSVSAMGMRQYVPIALVALGGLCIANIISAESVLVLPGSVGVILSFLSVFLQCDDFMERLGGTFCNISNK